ncbi:MAG: hypothetical protein Q8P06_00395 [Candidatus Azambacteria bacterium]|nr:hypothetical protein [Candidatus Azambacteria bacterium]
MKKIELEEILKSINNKIESVEILKSKIDRADNISKNLEAKLTTLEERRGNIKRFETEIESVKSQIEPKKQIVDDLAEKVNDYNAIIEEQKKEYAKLKENFDKLLGDNNDLEITIKNQLGLVSAEVLANSFFNEVGKLKTIVERWFKWLLGSYIALFISVISIAIWQVIEEGSLFKLTLLIRLPLITPIIFFVYFIEKQYSIDRKLSDEYIFKATVARSFEAYRKLLNEESACDNDDQNKLLEKKLDFVVESIKNIYTSPLVNLKDKDNNEVVGIGLLEKVVSIINKVIK